VLVITTYITCCRTGDHVHHMCTGTHPVHTHDVRRLKICYYTALTRRCYSDADQISTRLATLYYKGLASTSIAPTVVGYPGQRFRAFEAAAGYVTTHDRQQRMCVLRGRHLGGNPRVLAREKRGYCHTTIIVRCGETTHNQTTRNWPNTL